MSKRFSNKTLRRIKNILNKIIIIGCFGASPVFYTNCDIVPAGEVDAGLFDDPGGTLTAGAWSRMAGPITADEVNSPAAPGGRTQPATWRDSAGNLWMFGGRNGASCCNYSDLWKFDINAKTWSLVWGSTAEAVESSASGPGGRYETATWIDASDNLWIYGGSGNGFGSHNSNLGELWRYDIASNTWSLLYGSLAYEYRDNSTSDPGYRTGAATWITSDGSLWLFGGFDEYNYKLSDLMKYNPATNTWSLVSGVSACCTNNSSSAPGARANAVSWSDSSDNLWLFGGRGYDSAGWDGALNDLWKFNTSTNTWTHISGDLTRHTPTSNTHPGARYNAQSWQSPDGKLWLYGGEGTESGGLSDNLGDLWKYDPAANLWTLVWGVTANAPGTDNAAPNARNRGGAWVDQSGNLWLFGGWGYSTLQGYGGYMSDLWKYSP